MKKILLSFSFFLSILSAGFSYVSTPGYFPTPDQFPYAWKFSFNDIAYGKNAIVLLEFQHVYALHSIGEKPVVVQLPQHCNHLEFGNDVFVVAGNVGFLATSRDLRNWTYFEFSDKSIEQVENYGGNPNDHVRPQFSNLVFTEGKFHAMTQDGDYLVSVDGIHWELVGQILAANFPTDPNVITTDTSKTFSSNGKQIRFDVESATSRRVLELQDSGEWLATGVFPDSSFEGGWGLSNDVAIHTGTNWIGIHNGVLFEKKSDIWKIYNLLDRSRLAGFRSVDFAHDREEQAIYIGSKIDGLYRSKDGQNWEKLDDLKILNLDVDIVRYVRNNGFILASNIYDSVTGSKYARLFLTLYGDGPKLIFERENYTITDVAQMGLQVVVMGRGENEEDSGGSMVWRKRLPLEYNGLPTSEDIHFEDYMDGIDKDSTLTLYGSTSIPRVVGGNNYSNNNPEDGILTTRTKVYRRDDGEWAEVLEVPEHSWITCAYFYRNQYFIGATNYAYGTRIYVPPPEGTEPSNQLFYSSDSITWERKELDFQPLLDHPSTNGPQLIESVNTSLNVTRKFEAVEGPDLTATSDSLPTSTHYLWAKGKYLAYRDYSSEISPFLGFEDEWYHWMKYEDSLGNISGNTRGWFGSLDPTDYPTLKHNRFGEVEFEIDSEDEIYLTSDRYGVLKTSRSDVPYFTSLADGVTYFFGSRYYQFYNHSIGQWVETMDCESFDYEQWYEVCHDQVVRVQDVATATVVAVQQSDVLDAYDFLQKTIRENKTLSQFVKMGKALEEEAAGTDPMYEEWPINNVSFDALITTALDALNWASHYYSENI